MPVVPPVYSTTVPPGGSRPDAAARSISVRASRSFMLPVGFADSSLATIRPAPFGTTRRSSTSGVFPIAPRIVGTSGIATSVGLILRRAQDEAGRGIESLVDRQPERASAGEAQLLLVLQRVVARRLDVAEQPLERLVAV